VIESMTGARFVRNVLVEHGWSVQIADAHKVKGLAPLACKTDKIDAQVLARLSQLCSWTGAEAVLLPRAEGFEGLLLGSTDGPPNELAAPDDRGLPHRLRDLDPLCSSRHAELGDHALRTERLNALDLGMEITKGA
jgi:hypothetical protein